MPGTMKKRMLPSLLFALWTEKKPKPASGLWSEPSVISIPRWSRQRRVRPAAPVLVLPSFYWDHTPSDRRSYFRLLFLFAFTFLFAAASAYAQPTFEANANAKEVVLNGYFDLTFTLRDADGSNFQPPSFTDFVVVSGPSRSVRTSISNGQVSKELNYFYTLQPKRTGELTIGSASIIANGRQMRTRPLTLTVVKGKPVAGVSGQQFFVRAEPSVQTAYIGQQVILDYKLYTTTNIDNYTVVQESDYPGFFAEDIRRFDSRVMREVIDGVQFATKILKRVALFPQQAGILTVDPMMLQLGIVAEDPSQRRSLLFNRQVKRLPAQTEPVQITVRPLPDGAPPTFTGAVGTFTAAWTLNRTTVTTDDALSLRLSVAGDGDIKRVQPPPLDLEGSFEVYDPNIQEEASYELNGELTGRKNIQFLILPREAGVYNIAPTFTYFDTDSAQYVNLTSGVFTINVRPGSRRPGETAVAEDTSRQISDIRYLKGDTRLTVRPAPFFGTTAFWLTALFPFLALAGAVVIRRYRQKLNSLDPALLRRRHAQKEAHRRLAKADQFRRQDESRAFYDEVSKAMLGYVSDKLAIPRSELSKDNVRHRLASLSAPAEEIEKFLQIMHNCEIALFAGMDNAGAMQETYDHTVSVLTNIEAFLKDR